MQETRRAARIREIRVLIHKIKDSKKTINEKELILEIVKKFCVTPRKARDYMLAAQ